MHHHRDLCERAVSPLEIAAGLEAHGLTDRTAARYRHRDVFALAEELYARTPARPAGSAVAVPPPPGPDTEARPGGRCSRCCPAPPASPPPGCSWSPKGRSAGERGPP
ncbi:hypothetical protein Smic_55150 [Streptomyces microflavus]|uniref:Uncharacterized protein n=1 Tax=Streptomyces microflavus TaxID=1919 RepID=A0A7J0CXF7_STRMI|nr:hypothetical protein Smic_55150 [Streptomyces microflavus]